MHTIEQILIKTNLGSSVISVWVHVVVVVVGGGAIAEHLLAGVVALL